LKSSSDSNPYSFVFGPLDREDSDFGVRLAAPLAMSNFVGRLADGGFQNRLLSFFIAQVTAASKTVRKSWKIT